MTQELVYTSAPRGLKAGTNGFCTVAATPGLPKVLQERLEALSGYRHLFDPQDPRAADNPVAWFHIRLSLSGRKHHVLSRVADAGLDHTQRISKLAHHMVLQPNELPEAGPAWLLSQASLLMDRWQGDPRYVDARGLPTGRCSAAPCRAWEAAAGDAGWGGVLAATAMSGVVGQAAIIFQPGMQLLPLIRESLALLPAELRWNVTFTTYYTGFPPDVECRWRCVAAGTPEAAQVGRVPQTLVIDLTRPLPAPPDSAAVRAARAGVPIRLPKPAAATTVPPPRKPSVPVEVEQPIPADMPAASEAAEAALVVSAGTAPSAVEEMPAATAGLRNILAVVATVMLLATAAGLAVMSRYGDPEPAASVEETPAEATPTVSGSPDGFSPPQVEALPASPSQPESASKPGELPESPDAPVLPAAEPPVNIVKPSAAPATDTGQLPNGPARPVAAPLYVPAFNQVKGESLPADLLAADGELTLEVLTAGGENETRPVQLQVQRAADDVGQWQLIASGGIDVGISKNVLGNFHLEQGRLRFAKEQGSADDLLSNCVLQLQRPGQPAVAWAWRRPVSVETLEVELASDRSRRLKIKDAPEELHLEVTSVVRAASRNAATGGSQWRIETKSPRLVHLAFLLDESAQRPIRFDVTVRGHEEVSLECSYAGFETQGLQWEKLTKILSGKPLSRQNVERALGDIGKKLSDLQLLRGQGASKTEIEEVEKQQQQWQQLANALETLSAGWMIHYDLYVPVQDYRVLVASTQVKAALARQR